MYTLVTSQSVHLKLPRKPPTLGLRLPHLHNILHDVRAPNSFENTVILISSTSPEPVNYGHLLKCGILSFDLARPWSKTEPATRHVPRFSAYCTVSSLSSQNSLFIFRFVQMPQLKIGSVQGSFANRSIPVPLWFLYRYMPRRSNKQLGIKRMLYYDRFISSFQTILAGVYLLLGTPIMKACPGSLIVPRRRS